MEINPKYETENYEFMQKIRNVLNGCRVLPIPSTHSLLQAKFTIRNQTMCRRVKKMFIMIQKTEKKKKENHLVAVVFATFVGQCVCVCAKF